MDMRSPHVASKKRGTAIGGRTTRHDTYKQSIKDRKKIEEFFGWPRSLPDSGNSCMWDWEKIRFYLSLAAG